MVYPLSQHARRAPKRAAMAFPVGLEVLKIRRSGAHRSAATGEARGQAAATSEKKVPFLRTKPLGDPLRFWRGNRFWVRRHPSMSERIHVSAGQQGRVLRRCPQPSDTLPNRL